MESSQGRLSANSLAIAQEGRHRVPRQARVGEHRHALRGTHLAEARATSRATANAATNHAVHAAPNNHAGLIWAIADLPLVLLRRLDRLTREDSTTNEGKRANGLAFGRMNGRLPVDGLPARQPTVQAGPSESQRLSLRDCLARRHRRASRFEGKSASSRKSLISPDARPAPSPSRTARRPSLA